MLQIGGRGGRSPQGDRVQRPVRDCESRECGEPGADLERTRIDLTVRKHVAEEMKRRPNCERGPA